MILVCMPSLAGAQVYIGGQAPHRGSLEAGGGGTFVSGFDMGARVAELTTSGNTNPLDLFTTESKVSGFPGVSARVGYYLTRVLSVEGSVRFARPQVSVRLADDFESASDVTATETAAHYVFAGSLLFHLRQGGRVVPFVSAGAGHIRELHEGSQLVETGLEYHGTAGVKYWLGGGDHRFGLRFEAGFSAREKGLDDKDDRRLLPLVSAGLSYLF